MIAIQRNFYIPIDRSTYSELMSKILLWKLVPSIYKSTEYCIIQKMQNPN